MIPSGRNDSEGIKAEALKAQGNYNILKGPLQSVSGLFRHGSGLLLQVCSSGWSCVCGLPGWSGGGLVPLQYWRPVFRVLLLCSGPLVVFGFLCRYDPGIGGGSAAFPGPASAGVEKRRIPAAVPSVFPVGSGLCPEWFPGGSGWVFRMASGCGFSAGLFLASAGKVPAFPGLVVTCPAGSGIVSGRIRAGSLCGFFPGFGSFSSWFQM